MIKKLLALLMISGSAKIGGVQYLLATPRPGVTRADLVDAGIAVDCDAVEVSAEGRHQCQTRPDGGALYGTVKTQAWQCAKAGNPTPILVSRWPKQGAVACFEPLGDDSCQVNGPSFDDGGSPSIAVDQDRCACRARGQACRYQLPDGGTPLMNFNQTYSAPFAGAGCVRKACVEGDGEQGQSMDPSCL